MNKIFKTLFLSLFLTTLFFNQKAFACYPCSIMNVSRIDNMEQGKTRFTLSEKYISYDKAEDLTYSQQRDNNLVKSFNIAQVGFGYAITDSVALDLYLPVINRRADEITALRSNSENDSGIGDLVLASSLEAYSEIGDDWSFNSGLSLGIKLPTGDTETLEQQVQSDSENITRHHPAAIAGSGSNLVLGSGSTDFIFGTGAVATYKDFLLLGTFQYTLRTEGDYDYKFADDIIATIGNGYYLLLEANYSLALAGILSLEKKSSDSLDSQPVNASEFTDLYYGPSFLAGFESGLSAELGIDFKINSQENDAVITPDWRLKADLVYNF